MADKHQFIVRKYDPDTALSPLHKFTGTGTRCDLCFGSLEDHVTNERQIPAATSPIDAAR